MERILQGITPVTCYINDALITGRNDPDHLGALQKVLSRLD